MEMYYIQFSSGNYRSRHGYSTSNFNEAAIYPKRHVAERRAKESRGEVKTLYCSQEPFEKLEEVSIVLGRDPITDGPFVQTVRPDSDEAIAEADALNKLNGDDFTVVRIGLTKGNVPTAVRIHRAKMSQKGAVKYFKPKWETEVPVRVQVADDGVVHFAAESRDDVQELVREYRREPTATTS